MDYLTKTIEYYSNWVDISPERFSSKQFIAQRSKKREEAQKGYSKQFDLYYLSNDSVRIASYNEKMDKYIKDLSEITTVNTVEKFFEGIFPGKVQHSIKFYFDKVSDSIDTTETVKLTKVDYEMYSRFYSTENNCEGEDISWLKDFFERTVVKNYFWSIIDNGTIISTTEIPDVPYMEDDIVEIGISTLLQYRNKGNAKKVCTACLKQIINDGKTPIWSCGNTNAKSIRLAERIGFKYFADVIMVSI